MSIEMTIRPTTRTEDMYTYTQSSQIQGQTGCIGHLRADMDSTGEGFFSSWDDHRGYLKSDQFKEEFDQVINRLRFGPGDESGIRHEDGDTFLISNLCPWAYLVNPKLKMNTPSAWRIKMNDLRLEPYFEEFKNPLPDYVLIIDENIRDNNSNDFENSWLMKKIISENYQEHKTECGSLFKKSNL